MPATLFFSYSHRDEALRDELETHLVMLKRQGLLDVWHDRRIVAGDELDPAIRERGSFAGGGEELRFRLRAGREPLFTRPDRVGVSQTRE